ncbi:MAG: amidohydrolase, partial [Lachnospiraceae bacterium]|nr:amidohydrolase [Lachnospiraceae bacterium]
MWNECKEMQEYIVALRRDLHKIPEVGYHLPKTAAYVAKELDRLEIPYRLSEKDSSIIADIEGGKPGKCIALRADMDALPITEETGLPFSSLHKGQMHACGHDSHMAMLLAAARVLKAHQADLTGRVRLIFQTAEEQSRGAEVVLENGGMEGVDAVFGTHVGTIVDKNIPAGKFIFNPACCMASFDKFVIKIKGTGCHGSTPEKGVDPINIAAHIILSLQAVNSREIAATKPAVLTIGQI